MPYNAFTYGYTDTERVTYMMNIDFSYIINDVSNGYITITVLDDSKYSLSSEPCNLYDTNGNIISHAYEWRIFNDKGDSIPFSQNKDGSYNYVCYDKSFTISFYLIQNITVSYSVSNKYGTSTLKRVLYFNTYPTINALLSRTSTAINKDEDSNNYKLFSLDASEYDSLYSLIKNVMKSGYIKYATGLSLDLLAEAWSIYREDKETDESLRARIVQTIAYYNSSITRESLIELIAILFNISSNDVDLVERDDIPDYSWGATEEGIRKDMKPYDAEKRPAEFTFFIRNGPNSPVQMSYVRKLIEKSRAAGVYLNDVKITFITDYTLSFSIKDIVLYDELVLESGADWGRMSWGTQGEHRINSELSGTYIFDNGGKYCIICSTNGTNTSNNYYRTTIDVKNSANHDCWSYNRWGMFKWTIGNDCWSYNRWGMFKWANGNNYCWSYNRWGIFKWTTGNDCWSYNRWGVFKWTTGNDCWSYNRWGVFKWTTGNDCWSYNRWGMFKWANRNNDCWSYNRWGIFRLATVNDDCWSYNRWGVFKWTTENDCWSHNRWGVFRWDTGKDCWSYNKWGVFKWTNGNNCWSYNRWGIFDWLNCFASKG